MEKARKKYEQPWRGSFVMIARKCGCTPKYVSLVMNNKLGKYSKRNTELVKKICRTASEIEDIFKPQK